MNLTPRRQSLRFVAFVRRTGRLSHLSCPRCCCHRPFFRFFFVTIVDEFVISLCACFVVVPVGRCCVPAPALDVSSTTVHLALGRRHFEIVWWWTKHGERRTSEKFFSFSRASIRIILVAQELAYHWRTGLENWQLFFLSLCFFLIDSYYHLLLCAVCRTEKECHPRSYIDSGALFTIHCQRACPDDDDGWPRAVFIKPLRPASYQNAIFENSPMAPPSYFLHPFFSLSLFLFLSFYSRNGSGLSGRAAAYAGETQRGEKIINK